MSDREDARFRGPVPIIAFTSGKGGCGKTTIAVNFANVVASAGQKILLVDFDLANRGSTGLFAKLAKSASGRITTTTLLLHGEADDGGALLQVKPNLFFIPSSGAQDQPWKDDGLALEALVRQLRTLLEEVARKAGIACIVLDCFCGRDLLTTAATGLADDTVIVNEPDIVTFTGSLTLLEHLKVSWAQLERKPRLHFVINRMRSNFSVRDLTALYRDNLQQAVSEIILCHFPYHPRIFDTFGRYPFISDLLPRSLFVRKLELLAYLLYRGYADHLLKPKVRNWSRRKVRKIYERSIDGAAVDPQHLLSKFTGFPLLVGLWLLAVLALFRTFPLGPVAAWCCWILSGVTLGAIAIVSLLIGCWMAGRVNLSLGAFRLRLARRQENSLARLQYRAGALPSFFSGALMILTSIFLALNFSIVAVVNVAYAFNLRLDISDASSADATFAERQLKVALDSPARALDLRHITISGVSFFTGSAPNNLRGFLAFGTSTLTEGTTFEKCRFFSDIDLGRHGPPLEGATFVSCIFEESHYAAINHGTIALNLRNGKMIDCRVPRVVIFDYVTMDSVSVELANQSEPNGAAAEPQFVNFEHCTIRGLHLKRKGGGKIYLTTTNVADRDATTIEGEHEWVSPEEYERLIKSSSGK